MDRPPSLTPDALGARIRARRKDLGVTQVALANLAECSARFVRAVEGGKPTVRLDKLLAVLDVLGLELDLVRRGERG